MSQDKLPLQVLTTAGLRTPAQVLQNIRPHLHYRTHRRIPDTSRRMQFHSLPLQENTDIACNVL